MPTNDDPTLQDPFAAILEDAEDLYENAPCGYLSTLPDGTIARVNATFLAWTGYRRGDLVAHRRFQTLLAPGDRIFYETHYAPLLRMQDAVREIAVEVVCADGRRLPVLLNSVVKRDAEGAMAYFRTSVFDARQRREYERELLRARQQAEQSEARARELAQALQETFIPPAPAQIPGFEVGGAYRPAGDGSEVGGDFYDVFATGGDRWAVALGDVRGKGVAAARVTALARYTLRAAATQERSPARVLTLLNEALCRSDEDRFCTVVFAVVDAATPTAPLTLVVGGHAPPVLVRPDGRTDAAGAHGDLVGVLDDPVFNETSLALQPNEVLCLFTDGVTDGRRGSEHYGDDRLHDVLRRSRECTASDIADAVVADVLAFQGGSARDDIAVVVLKRAPEGS